MATITYNCNVCDRSIDLVENTKGLTTMSKCVITYGCRGKLNPVKRNVDNIRESFPTEVQGVIDFSKRKALFDYTQSLPSNIWTIVHDLNTDPAIVVYVKNISTTELELMSPSLYTILRVNSNEIKITFNNTYSGTAQLVSRNSISTITTTTVSTEDMTQVSVNGYFTVAVPKYLTKFYSEPTITPIPSLPYNLEGVAIRAEITIKKPNQEAVTSIETFDSLLTNTPWTGWNEILLRKRRNYYLYACNILKFSEFSSNTLSTIPNGTQITISKVDFGTGVLQPILSETFIGLLAQTPYTSNDKIKNKIVDIGDMYDNTISYMSFSDGDFYVDSSNVEKTYPDIIKVQ